MLCKRVERTLTVCLSPGSTSYPQPQFHWRALGVCVTIRMRAAGSIHNGFNSSTSDECDDPGEDSADASSAAASCGTHTPHTRINGLE